MSSDQRAQQLREIDFRHLWHPFTAQKVWFDLGDPLIIERAHGVYLFDTSQRRYLDGVSSLWCNVHGHGVPELIEALQTQAAELCHSSLLGLSHVPVLELTEELMEWVPANLKRVFYSDSGSAAVEAALRMALEWWQKQATPAARKKQTLVSLSNAYHGDTLGSVGLGYLREFHQDVSHNIIASQKVNPPHLYSFYEGFDGEAALEKSLGDLGRVFEDQADTIAAFVFEPLVQGAAGIWLQPVEFLLEVQALCRRHEVLLIADEVATGFGKTGAMFAANQGPLEPDILVVGKGLSAGYLPLSAAIATEDIFEGFLGEPEELKTFFFGQTYCGNPLAARVAKESLRLFEKHDVFGVLPGRIEHFKRELEEKIAPLAHVDEVRVCGVMCGIELSKVPGERASYAANELAGARVALEARKRGAVIRPLGNVVVLMPILSMTEEQLTELVTITAAAIVAALGE